MTSLRFCCRCLYITLLMVISESLERHCLVDSGLLYFLLFASITESMYALIFGAGSSHPSGLITLLSLGL